eukprot:scaffold30708_cov44-Phaeocystis_antarctica.AAC.3
MVALARKVAAAARVVAARAVMAREMTAAGAVQVAPNQPSPKESESWRVQLPGDTACIAE